MKNSILTFVFILLIGFCGYSQTGKVIKVKDGDTVVILDKDNVQHTIRVADIDCPEKNQPYGKKAKWFTSDQIYLKTVVVKAKKKDKYGRTIGFILYENKNLSLELLKAGLAWHYKYYSNDKEMARLENIAKNNNKGLWAESNPINPYNWRKGQRN
ncbi:hypothetical protein HN014_22250 (plasmid) [Aquimarina sp. TRL1]|uniref:thermonuclease family protein n=1 Tax=Aquimarina sp. (strain TRL1) TaxID=2736252 RepID=UPI00158BFAAF|nr:thermonuclease family protein [Aquimarina sp. TRL1]QKX07724.1 hypothetical protein HN014_22250 [Aquimarina sp. TRL1]